MKRNRLETIRPFGRRARAPTLGASEPVWVPSVRTPKNGNTKKEARPHTHREPTSDVCELWRCLYSRVVYTRGQRGSVLPSFDRSSAGHAEQVRTRGDVTRSATKTSIAYAYAQSAGAFGNSELRNEPEHTRTLQYNLPRCEGRPGTERCRIVCIRIRTHPIKTSSNIAMCAGAPGVPLSMRSPDVLYQYR